MDPPLESDWISRTDLDFAELKLGHIAVAGVM